MHKMLLSLSFIVFLLSALVYVSGRLLFPGLLSDDAGDGFLWAGGISLAIILWSKIKSIPAGIRSVIHLFLGLAILFFGIFGLWGLFSTQGRQQYQEMSGLIPFYSLMISLVLLIFLAIIQLIWRKR